MNPWDDYRGADGAVDPAKLAAAERSLAASNLDADARTRLHAKFAAIRASRTGMPSRFSADSTGNEVVIDILGSIGEDWWSGEGTTAAQITRVLRDAGARTVRVRINSGGGDAFEGDAIRTLLASAKNRVEVEVLALAGSSASVIAMAADPGALSMAENAVLMIHDARVGVHGGESELSSALQLLRATNEGAAAIYARRAGREPSEMRSLMRAETWLTASEALELGLADRVVPGVGVTQAAGEIPEAVKARLATPKLLPPSRRDTNALVTIRERLGLAADATEEQVIAALDIELAKKENAPAPAPVETPTQAAPVAVPSQPTAVDQAQAEVTLAAAKELHTAAALAAVERAITDGKVPPAARDAAIRMCGENAVQLAAAVAYFAQAPVVVPVASRTVAAAPVASPALSGKLTPATMSDRQKRMCREAGISAEEFCKQVNKD